MQVSRSRFFLHHGVVRTWEGCVVEAYCLLCYARLRKDIFIVHLYARPNVRIFFYACEECRCQCIAHDALDVEGQKWDIVESERASVLADGIT